MLEKQMFNFSKTYDFIPELSVEQRQLEVVYCTKLLGITITSDCKWDSLVTDLVRKANKKMWFLIRLKTLGASTDTLVTVFKLFIRQGLEIAAPLWTSALNKGQIAQLESVQCKVTSIILGPFPPPRSQNRRELLNLPPMQDHRLSLTKKFAIKMSQDSKFSYLFPKRDQSKTRNKQPYVTPICLTKRFQTSSIPSFIDILNKETHM